MIIKTKPPRPCHDLYQVSANLHAVSEDLRFRSQSAASLMKTAKHLDHFADDLYRLDSHNV